MKKLIFILLLFVATNCYAWDDLVETQLVDLIELKGGFYTSAATVTGSVSSIPIAGNFANRRTMIITNSDDYNIAFITDTPFKNYIDAGYKLLPNSSLSMDVASDITVYIITSDNTTNISISTIEIR